MNSRVNAKLLLFAAACFLLAQPAAGQSSRSRPTKEVNDWVAKAHAMSQAAAYDSAVSYATRAMQQAQAIGYPRGEAKACDELAELMFKTGRHTEMNMYDVKLVDLAQHLRDTLLWINGLNRRGIYLMGNGQPAASEELFRQLLDLGLEKEQSVKTAEVYSNLGSANLTVGNHEKAMEWFFKALRLREKHDQKAGIGETYSNIASVFYLMKRIEDAIQFQQNSIRVRQSINDLAGLVIANVNIGQLYILKEDPTIAHTHLQQAVHDADDLSNPMLQASAYVGMGTYYSRNNVLDSALLWQSRAIKIFEEMDNKTQLSRLYVAVGILAHRTNDSLHATEYLHKALDLALVLKNKENIANAYEHLSRFYEDHGDIATAFGFYKEHRNYRDSIAAQSALADVEEIRMQYETEKKDFEIERLTSEQQIKQLQIEKQNALLAGNLLEAEQKELRLRQQGEELERQTLEAQNTAQQLQLNKQEHELQQRQLKNSRMVRNVMGMGVLLLAVIGYFLFNRYQLQRTIKDQQNLLDIRNHIAKDLHDEIGSTLTSIKILSDVSGRRLQADGENVSTYLKQIASQSAMAQQGMSDIVWAVKPDNDKLGNMEVRMREYVAQTLEPIAVDVTWLLDLTSEDKVLDMAWRRDFLLIFKEAINNIAKHASASNVHIKFVQDHSHLRLSISDDGRGFNVACKTSSSGLANMHRRAEALGGKLEITTRIGEGSAVTLLLPLGK